MEKGGGLLSVLGPVLGLGAAALAPELLPALAGGELAGGAAEAAPFLIPGTETALEGASIPLGELGAGTSPFLIPGTDTPLVSGATTGLGGGQVPLGLLDTTGGAAGIGAGAGAAAGAAPELGGAPGLLAAQAPTAATGAAPLASTAPGITGPLDVSAPAAVPASPISAAASAPPGLSLSPDLTATTGVGDMTGPEAGQTIGMNVSGFGPADTAATGGVGGVADPFAGAGATSIGDLSTQPISSYGGMSLADLGGLGLGPGGPGDVAAAGGGGGGGGFDLGASAGKTGSYLLEHPGLPLTAGIAGMQLLKGNPQYPDAKTLAGFANPAGAAGANLTGTGAAGLADRAAATAGESAALTAPLTTGVLPPGLQQTVDASTQAQKAQVRSAYGNAGLTGSTMEADKLAQIDSNAASQTASIATGLLTPAQGFSGQANNALSQLTSTGANLTGLSLNAYNALLSAQMKSDQNYQTALYNFARALAGSGYSPPTTSV